MLDTGLDGKVAVVTGANNPIGIGAAIAKALSAQGVKVFLTYKRIAPESAPTEEPQQAGEALYNYHRARGADEIVSQIKAAGGDVVAQEFDLSDPAAVPQLFDAAEAAYGPVNILINNAAHWEPATFLSDNSTLTNSAPTEFFSGEIPTINADLHDRVFAVNTRGSTLMMAEFARRHIVRGDDWGRIINLSTDAADRFATEAAYGASKWALESYTRSAADELGQFGITVNIISPGPIQTGYIPPSLANEIIKNTPMRAVGQPEHIADAVLLLVSHQARWVTGQKLHVGGGHRM